METKRNEFACHWRNILQQPSNNAANNAGDVAVAIISDPLQGFDILDLYGVIGSEGTGLLQKLLQRRLFSENINNGILVISRAGNDWTPGTCVLSLTVSVQCGQR